MTRPKIAIIHPRLIPGGGSEAKPMWMLETFKNDYDLYLITMGEVDLNILNEAYGTNLKPEEIKIISFPIPMLFKRRFDALRGYKLARFCKDNASQFDLMISTYNTMDFGKRGIQCIADFSFDDKLRRAFHPELKGLDSFIYRASPLRTFYLKLGKKLAGISKDNWKRNLTIANSLWTEKIMKDVHGIESRVIYPPVASKFPNIPWNNREFGFISLARLVPEKRIDRVIEILRRVRSMGWDIHFHILGRLDNSDYGAEIRKLCEKSGDWISLEGMVIGQKKLEFIVRHKFSISGRDSEPFGIAVVETAKAGCIVWVPNGGGQVEIVNHPSLIYDDLDDAVNKISRVLNNAAMQETLLAHLNNECRKFSTQIFQFEINDVVKNFLKHED